MEKLKERLQSCEAALATLDEALRLPFSVIVRDAAIQRFEYSFESAWKLLKGYLEAHEGIVCNSPNGCFREALQTGLLLRAEIEVCLIMTDDRNLTSHTYLEASGRTHLCAAARLSDRHAISRTPDRGANRKND